MDYGTLSQFSLVNFFLQRKCFGYVTVVFLSVIQPQQNTHNTFKYTQTIVYYNNTKLYPHVQYRWHTSLIPNPVVQDSEW